MVDDDKTSPQGDPLIHWVQWKIPRRYRLQEQPSCLTPRALSDWRADVQRACPPAGQTHHYRSSLLALSKPIDLPNVRRPARCSTPPNRS